MGGSVAISEFGQEDLNAVRIRLCGKPLELLIERQLLSAGVSRLSLAHHVNHLDPTQDCPSGCHRLKSEHRPDPSLDGAMILFDAIVQVSTLPDPDRLQFAP
jgi:hypothetical protein